jgi:exopolysaccharide biosynthesis polyprenyl glycosylphosphotransferase
MQTETEKAFDMGVGATGPITRAISRRRSYRRQWRIFECIAVFILDALLIDAAFRLAYVLRYQILWQSPILKAINENLFDGAGRTESLTPLSDYATVEMWVVIGFLAILAVRRLYTMRLTGNWFRQCWNIIVSSTVGMAFLISYYFIFQLQANSRLLVPFVWVTAIVLLSLGRLVFSVILGSLYRLGLGETRLLIVGSGRLGKMVMQHIAANPNLGYSIVGFLHDINESPSDFGRFKMLGSLNDLGLVIRSMQIDEVIIALPSNMHHYAIRSVKMCERLGASFKLIPDIYEMNLSRIDVESIEGIPLIGIKQISLNRKQRFVTRATDMLIATLVLILGSPLWLLISLLIKVTSAGPVIYGSTRVGLDGRLFQFYKFRTMSQDADKQLVDLLHKNEAQGPFFKMKDDPRMTTIGKFLRRTSLDEIPNLINVLKGEMSLVGPRPPIPHEVEQYEDWQKGRLAIKPGITGLWQIRGRSNLNFEEAVLLDLYYIENWSLRLYFQILFSTIPAVLFSRGAY